LLKSVLDGAALFGAMMIALLLGPDFAAEVNSNTRKNSMRRLALHVTTNY
jgi:hypothetical protein